MPRLPPARLQLPPAKLQFPVAKALSVQLRVRVTEEGRPWGTLPCWSLLVLPLPNPLSFTLPISKERFEPSEKYVSAPFSPMEIGGFGGLLQVWVNNVSPIFSLVFSLSFSLAATEFWRLGVGDFPLWPGIPGRACALVDSSGLQRGAPCSVCKGKARIFLKGWRKW